MEAKKCDRCGALFEVNNNYKEIAVNVTQCRATKDDNYLTLDYPVEFTFDLCPKCMNEIYDIFMRGVKNGD